MKENDFYCDQVFTKKTGVEALKETSNVLAFYHTKPVYELHIVIVPKRHIRSIEDIEDLNIIKEIFRVAQGLIVQFKLTQTNFRIITNGGSSQDSKHVHFHLISGDKLHNGQ